VDFPAPLGPAMTTTLGMRGDRQAAGCNCARGTLSCPGVEELGDGLSKSAVGLAGIAYPFREQQALVGGYRDKVPGESPCGK
jgi:hypothetical protein